MLQSSQIENPRCSAKIDQIRLRRAMNLPRDSQNFSSSGFQSEIQAVPCLPISVFPSGWPQTCLSEASLLGGSQGLCQSHLTEKSETSRMARWRFDAF